MLSGYSDATVKVITGLFRELETDASTGRAEGLRRSMLALIDRGGDNSQAPAQRLERSDLVHWHGTADFRAAAISSGIGGWTDVRRA
jgi:hypothetical protein